MATRKSSETMLVAALRDPDGARLVTEILQGLQSITKRMGGSQPVVEALSSGFALMDDVKVRSEYDELRRQLMRYLQAVDTGDFEPPPAERAPFHTSPDLSDDELSAVAESRLAACSRDPKLDG